VPWWVWPTGGALLGSVFGSFIAALVIRWPLGRSIISGRSACDACGHILSARELVPIISALLQRGKCQHCGAAIDWRHLAIEVAAAFVGGVAFGVSPDLAGLAGALFGWILIALIALDAEHYWLPDRLTLPLLTLGLCVGLVGVEPPLVDRLWGAAGGYLSLAAIAFAYKRARGRDGLGGGDPKLLAAIGAWLGWQYLPIVLLGGSGVGLLYVLFRTLRGRPMTATDRLPLGALMALAAFPLWVYAQYGVTTRF
jgi:leader peptidase (prepilin peptidase) / N-methyltransferase